MYKNKKNKRFVVTNLVWNKHYSNYLKEENDINTIISEGNKLLNDLKLDKRISYCIFSCERGALQDKKSFHFQGYLEFNRTVDALAFNKEFNFSDIQKRKGSQDQAIEYIKKEKSKVIKEFFQFGELKKQGRILKKFNDQDPDIRKSLDFQRILLSERIKENFYERFEDIENDFKLLFIKYYDWCKKEWNRLYIRNNDNPAKTIWIYGESGVGKTIWTSKLLKERGYDLDKETLKKKMSSINNQKIWFTLDEEKRKVLRIEEVRPNFPNYIDCIQLIDRATKLETKGNHIINNFELIVFNSLDQPEKIFENLETQEKKQILRRLYDGEIYELIPDKKTYNKIIDRSKDYPFCIRKTMEFKTAFKNNKT